MTEQLKLWEILVPTIRHDGRPIKLRYHKVWDSYVIGVAGGSSIMPVAKGNWVNPEGQKFAERMIPVRIACTDEQMTEILQFTINYYDQEAVMAYVVSSQVVIAHRDKKDA